MVQKIGEKWRRVIEQDGLIFDRESGAFLGVKAQ
jgi:hypothetical protein